MDFPVTGDAKSEASDRNDDISEYDLQKQELSRLLKTLAGKVVSEVRHEPGYSSLCMDFTDGTTLDINGIGCDDVASVEVYGEEKTTPKMKDGLYVLVTNRHRDNITPRELVEYYGLFAEYNEGNQPYPWFVEDTSPCENPPERLTEEEVTNGYRIVGFMQPIKEG